MTKPDLAKVPRSALNFEATLSPLVSVETRGPMEPYPITIRARTGGIANQEFWGPCVHDLEGFIAPDGPIAINYCHDREELIGGTTEIPSIDNGELIAPSLLVPFKADDRASEVICKGPKGVPYRASIQLDFESLEVQFLEPNIDADVNGQTFTGPLVIFRKWSIEAISICPFGADSKTGIDFARGEQAVSIRSFSAGASTVPKDAPAGDPTKLTAFSTWFTGAFGVSPETATEQQLTDFAAQFVRGKTAQPDERTTAQRMLADFGDQGAVWFAQGKTYDEAAGLFRAANTEELTKLREKITALEAENATLKTKADFHRGHPTPAAFTPPPDPAQKPAMADFNGQSAGAKKLAAAIRMPGQQAPQATT